MVRRKPPATEEGWYALHELRAIDWAAWRDAPERVRERAVDEATEFLTATTDVADAENGASMLYAVTGDAGDLMLVHLRPTLEDVELLERQFERTELGQFTEQTESFVSVTEASGYSERAREYFEGELDESSGLATYMRSRLYPQVPDHEYVSFYPMDKRRAPDQNWYDLPFEERAEHMDSHGDIGRDYAGRVSQMITGSIGLDDWEWGVTLWADDLTDVKELLYEMRFDPSTSKYAEFGPFYVGQRFPPADLGAYLAGERVPTAGFEESKPAAADHTDTPSTPAAAADGAPPGGPDGHEHDTAASDGHAAEETDERPVAGSDEDATHGTDEDEPAEEPDDGAGGRPPTPGDADVTSVDDIDHRLADFGVMPGEYDDGDHGLVCYLDADAEDVVDDVEGLRENFDHYDTHVLTSVRADQGEAAIVSVWETERAATTAAGFLTDIEAVSRPVAGVLGDPADDSGDGSDTAGDDGAVSDADGGNGSDTDTAAADIRAELADQGVYAGQPHGEDVYALVLYSTAGLETLTAEVTDLRDGFDRYDTHVKTAVYESGGGLRAVSNGESSESGESDESDADDVVAVVSLWDTQDAADTAADFLTDLPDIVGRPEDREGFGTMGMFYTVKPDYRAEFVDTFGAVGEQLTEMDGHRETALLVNHENDTDMFIASRWDAKEDAMAFFRSEEFRDTVAWGREVLADQPRHVFLA